MRCCSCNEYLEDSDRMCRELNATGKFIPQNANAAAENVGFHWNALSTMSWGKLAELYLRAKEAARRGDLTLLRQFYQKRLALPWREYEEDFKLEVERTGFVMSFGMSPYSHTTKERADRQRVTVSPGLALVVRS